MRINLSPVRSDETLKLERKGETLIINGDPADFSVIPAGASLPGSAVDCPFIPNHSTISRTDEGILEISVLLPLGPNPSYEACFPEPIIDPPDGEIALPATNVEPEPLMPTVEAALENPDEN